MKKLLEESVAYAVKREIQRNIEKNRYKIVILDEKLPDISGIEILEEMNRNNIKTNIIFLTGYGDEETMEKAMKLGAIDGGVVEAIRLVLDHPRRSQPRRAGRQLDDAVLVAQPIEQRGNGPGVHRSLRQTGRQLSYGLGCAFTHEKRPPGSGGYRARGGRALRRAASTQRSNTRSCRTGRILSRPRKLPSAPEPAQAGTSSSTFQAVIRMPTSCA